MHETPRPALSVAALFAERDAHRRSEKAADEQLKRKQQEQLADFRKRLDQFQVTDAHVEAVIQKIRRAFEQGESELMLTSFPSAFCSDNGRAIANVGTPPINKPDPKEAAEDREPEWLATLPAGAREVYKYWNLNLKPGGFGFGARIISYPGGMPGDVGLFFSWPKSAMEAKS